MRGCHCLFKIKSAQLYLILRICFALRKGTCMNIYFMCLSVSRQGAFKDMLLLLPKDHAFCVDLG